GVEPDAAHAEAEAALHLADRLLDAEGRHAGEADQAVGRHLHELLRDPVVVGLHARALELGVGIGEEVAHHTRRAEQHLGVDAVDVLLREPRLGAEVSLVRLGEGDAGPAHVRVLASGRGVDADRRRRRVGAELPGLAALPAGLEAREALERYRGSPARGRLWRGLEPLADVHRAERFYGTVDLRLEGTSPS